MDTVETRYCGTLELTITFSWFVYDRGARRSEPARDQAEAVSRARELNGARV